MGDLADGIKRSALVRKWIPVKKDARFPLFGRPPKSHAPSGARRHKGEGLEAGRVEAQTGAALQHHLEQGEGGSDTSKVIASFVGCLSATIALKTQITTDNKNDDADNSHND